MKAVILAGGYATRLRTITNNGEFPKTLLPIDVDGNPRPILFHMLEKIVKLKQVDEIIIVANEKYKQQIKDSCDLFYSTNEIYDKSLTILSDGSTGPENATGANNAIRVANAHIPANYRGNVLVMASDNYFELDLNTLLKYYDDLQDNYGDYINLIVSKVYPDSEREFIAKHYGIICADKYNHISSLDEKPGIENLKSNNVSLALYILNRQDFGEIDNYMAITEDVKKRDNLGCFINHLITTCQNCYTYPFTGTFYDIGTPTEYNALCPKTKKL